MSVETEIQTLTEAVEALTDAVGFKQAQLDTTVASVERAAAEVAAVTGVLFDSVALGLSATVEGQQFRVRSYEDDIASYRYVQESDGSATLLEAIPSAGIMAEAVEATADMAAVAEVKGARDAALSAKTDAEAARDQALTYGNINQTVANQAARLALTGLAVNWRVLQSDTQNVWQWSGTAWVDRGESPLKSKASISAVDAALDIRDRASDRIAFSPWLSSALIVGDSRAWQGQMKWKNAVPAASALDLASGFAGYAHPEGTSGTVEFDPRSGDPHLRWTANGDTAGPWTPMVAGVMLLDSGTPGPGLRLELPVRKVTGLPTGALSVAVAVSGALNFGNRVRGAIERAMHMMRWPFGRLYNAAIGGNVSAGVIEQLPVLRWRGAGPGVAFVLLGTNDISNSTPAETIIANLTTIYERLASQGLRLVIIGEHARWGTNSSTPMTPAQIAIFDAVRDFQRKYANVNGHIYVDAYAVTFNSASEDRRPLPGMLSDHVHPSAMGAQVIGAAIAAAVTAWVGQAAQRNPVRVNRLTHGAFDGSTGTTGNGGSGTVPTRWSARRAGGADATIASSLVPRTDGVSGNWWRLEIDAPTAGAILAAESPASFNTLSSLGLSVGDTVEMSVEYRIEGAVNIGAVRPFLLCNGRTPTTWVNASFGDATDVQLDEAGMFKTPPFVIPEGTTGLQQIAYVYPKAAGEVTLYLADWRIEKLNA